MLKQLFSLDHGRESIPDGIRASSAILALYVAFLPIATGLTGLIGSISPLNYIAALYFVVSFAELLRRAFCGTAISRSNGSLRLS